MLLSFAVIVAFLGYSIHQQQENQEAITNVGSLRNNETLKVQGAITPTTGQAGPTPGKSGNMMNTNGMNGRMMGQYKNGVYTGSTEDVFYGNIQVRATVSSGKLTDIEFLQYPNDRQTSIMINSQAMPILKQEAITAQSSQVDIVSGATDSSVGFRRSLANALAQAN